MLIRPYVLVQCRSRHPAHYIQVPAASSPHNGLHNVCSEHVEGHCAHCNSTCRLLTSDSIAGMAATASTPMHKSPYIHHSSFADIVIDCHDIVSLARHDNPRVAYAEDFTRCD
jgi:hypothetical protein